MTHWALSGLIADRGGRDRRAVVGPGLGGGGGGPRTAGPGSAHLLLPRPIPAQQPPQHPCSPRQVGCPWPSAPLHRAWPTGNAQVGGPTGFCNRPSGPMCVSPRVPSALYKMIDLGVTATGGPSHRTGVQGTAQKDPKAMGTPGQGPRPCCLVLTRPPAPPATGFAGQNCEENIDDCPGNSCQNGGTCVDGVNTYNCRCPPEWTGTCRGKRRGGGQQGVVTPAVGTDVALAGLCGPFAA